MKSKHPAIDFSPPQEIIAQPDQPYYKVQIMASIDELDVNIPEFKKLGYPVEMVKVQSTSMYKFKYYIGPFTDKKDAKKAQKEVQDNGYSDAFIVYFE